MRKPSFSESAVTSRLESCFGTISNLSQIRHGGESQVYRFTGDDRRLIVRINRTVEGFEKDIFARCKFEHLNLPIPEVVRIGRINDHFFCISEEVPGATLQDLNRDALTPVLGPTARVLDEIAKSDLACMTGFGPFDANGIGKYESWRDFLIHTAVPEIKQMNPFLRRLEALIEHCPEISGLIHGDFGSKNVLTDGRRITAVVDWSEAMIGDPLYDVANVFFWRTWLDCMEQQARYFETYRPDLPDLNDRLLCYQLRIGLSEVFSKSDAAGWAMSRCGELVQSNRFA
jgi:hygromycin-B 4-O-kinase